MKTSLLTFIIILSALAAQSQILRQTIRGTVTDRSNHGALPFASVHVKGLSPALGGVTDTAGVFAIKGVPIGRITLEVSFTGYETLLIPELELTSAKELQVAVELQASSRTLSTVVIGVKTNKQRPLNDAALVSARMLSVDEANRYAGGFDDPARLASSFAGVSGAGGQDNAIVVRGNSPKFLQWKVEGVEIPNPNHFANLNSLGGGGLTAFSSNLLANSDFLTGAFPAEYNNALAGVFDMRLRNGNSNRYEHSVEVGLIGIDLTSEGPINKKQRSSYLINYRYSTLGLLSSLMPDNAEGTKYQDLSFKLNFPTKKAGTFSLWGIGLIDNSGSEPKKEIAERKYTEDIEQQNVDQFMGSIGFKHNYQFKNSSYIRSTVAFSNDGIDLYTKRLDAANALQPQNGVIDKRYNLTFKSTYYSTLSPNLSNSTGVTSQGMAYKLNIRDKKDNLFQTLTNQTGQTALLSAYTNFQYKKDQFTANFGVNAQVFTLNKHRTVEPRAGISYAIDDKSSLSAGYGLHSRIEPLYIYFSKPTQQAISSNKNLDFTKAHHFVLGYDRQLSESVHLKIEPYYQMLFDVPIAANSNKSLLNLQSDWLITDNYFNTGKGRNYGLDVTLERYLKNGFYYLLSGSVFRSEYKSNTSDWLNTRYNKNVLVNALFGKEFNAGKTKQNRWGFNLRGSVQGGARYSAIDAAASTADKDIVYNENVPFTNQTKPSIVVHTTISYTWNKAKTTQKISLKVLNVTNYKDFLGYRYNLQTGGFDANEEALQIPNLSYKLYF